MNEREAPLNIAAGVAMARHREQLRKAEYSQAEIKRIIEDDSVKLHELNPLIHRLNLEGKESINTIRQTILKKIIQKNGMLPELVDSMPVLNFKTKELEPRFVIRFETSTLEEKQIRALERITKETYGPSVRTRKDIHGNDIPTENYPPLQLGAESRSKTGGWYFGPNLEMPTDPTHKGIYVYKDYGPITRKNFNKDDLSAKKYIIDIREGSTYQTDIVALATQVAQVLGEQKVTNRGQLIYESYYDLIRLGLKKVDSESIYGMEDQMSVIRRGLLTPLASPNLSKAIRVEPQSVLMVGVPGTGKTLIAEQLLNSDTGLFVLPIDPLELQKQLVLDKDKQTVLQRIAEVAKITGRKIILHIDDIENMVGDENSTHSTILNLMAGVQESGFHIIASTNKPEKIDSALLQPQRFGIVLHCGLQNERARYEIAKIHATEKSENLQIELFPSLEHRELILKEVARKTKYFTPRYVAGVATLAKYNLMDRIRSKKGTGIGLKEKDLNGFKFNLDDWEQALMDASSVYDSESVRRRDEELRNFVSKKQKENLGFPTRSNQKGHSFSVDVIEKVKTLEKAASLEKFTS